MDVLEVSRSAQATGPLCDYCLGRLVADRSFGLTNADRGHSLRVAVALAADEPYEPPENPCWVCEGECGDYDSWADRAVAALRGYDFATYQVGTKVPPLLEENDELLREDVGQPPDAGEPLKTEFNREVGKRIGTLTDTVVDFERPDVQVTLDLATETVDVQVNSAFVYGRYRKHERHIPQTEWPCTACNATGTKRGEECPECEGSGYRYDRSVEQLTAPVIRDAMDGEEAVFHGAGREDVDARMLGSGRPFVVEVTSPRQRDVDTGSLVEEVNDFADGAVEVLGLRLATYDMVERVKELDASKTYSMTVRFDEPVDQDAFAAALATLEGATVDQETPARVDHRRASKTRTRTVYAIEGELGADEGAATATVEIHGEGGLYVKELVSGDDGRTAPSLAGELNVTATVTALDVVDVTGEDAPFEDPDYFRSGENSNDPEAATDT